ncbi:hypothetical protein DEW08_09085 [Azospirillum thermophilum]|uniref:Uncharacterized protein n=2 Tax=Azospirillum thermophilum TaxID=2202148 RepID=A0A2S2CPL2_9PROT|nr:hypothetical protein DEW08_09085 [Azospirillum thermophilum]
MLLAAALGAAGPGVALPAHAADPALPEARIRTEVTRLVPPPWRVEEVTVTPQPGRGGPAASSSSSSSATSTATARVVVRLSLGEPTFTVEGRDGPLTFIRPVAAPPLEKTLNAVATVTRGKTGVETRIDLKNPEVMQGLGQPASALPGLTVIAGSDEARRLQDEREETARRRMAEEQERQTHEGALLSQVAAAARAEAERMEAERRAVEARTARITDLRAKLTGADRPARIAAYEAAMGGNDATLRQIAFEAAVRSRDPVLANLALKDWLARRRSIPIQLFATKEDPSSDQVVQNLGPLTVEIESFTPITGAVAARMGAPGYSIARPSGAIGSLAQTELILNSYGCTLALRLTEHATLDGLLRCQTLPTLIARVTLD